jgi:hypothetical protein
LRLGIAARQFGRGTRRRFRSGRGRRGMELRRRRMELRRRGIEARRKGRREAGLSGITLLKFLLVFLLLAKANHDVVPHPVAMGTCLSIVAVLGNMGLTETNEASLLLDEAAFSVIGSRVGRAAEGTMAMLVTQ